jgi:hypothetical protein
MNRCIKFLKLYEYRVPMHVGELDRLSGSDPPTIENDERTRYLPMVLQLTVKGLRKQTKQLVIYQVFF